MGEYSHLDSRAGWKAQFHEGVSNQNQEGKAPTKGVQGRGGQKIHVGRVRVLDLGCPGHPHGVQQESDIH